jgi:hypothetical protein
MEVERRGRFRQEGGVEGSGSAASRSGRLTGVLRSGLGAVISGIGEGAGPEGGELLPDPDAVEGRHLGPLLQSHG